MKRIFLLLILFCWNAYSYVYFPFNPNAALPGVVTNGQCGEPTTYQLEELHPFYKPGIRMILGMDQLLYSPSNGGRYEARIRYYNGASMVCPMPSDCEFGAWNETVAPAGASSIKVYTEQYVIASTHSCDLPAENVEIRATPHPINNDFRTIGIESMYFKQSDREYCIDKPFADYLNGGAIFLKQNVPTEFGIKFRNDLRQISFDLTTSLNLFYYAAENSSDSSTYNLANANTDSEGILKFNFLSPTVPANLTKDWWSFNFKLRGKYSNNVVDEYLRFGLYSFEQLGRISFEEKPVVTDSPEITIAQFFKDPRDEQGNSIVSSGKNLDIEVQSGLDVGENIAGTELKIKNLNTNSYLSQTYFPTSNNVLTGGLVKFEVNTLPDFNLDTDVQFEISIKFDNKCRPGKLNKLFVKRSRILKSNSFNVLFVKVAPQVDGQFGSADQTKYLITVNKTKDYFKTIGVVSDKKINFSETVQNVYYKANDEIDDDGVVKDLKKLNSMRSKFKPKYNFLNKKNPDLVVGVTADDYFMAKNICIFLNGNRVCALGVSMFDTYSILMRQEQIPVLLHEFGHVICTRYDGIKSCDSSTTSGAFLNKDITHNNSLQSTNPPYSNYTNTSLMINRGQINNAKNVMSSSLNQIVDGNFGITGDYWIDEITFHSMLTKFNPVQSKRDFGKQVLESDDLVNISASIDDNGYFQDIENIITSDTMYIDQCQPQGAYKIDFIDERGSIIKSCWHNPTQMPHATVESESKLLFVINMRYRYPLKTVKIIVTKNAEIVYKWYLPTSPLANMLRYIPKEAYKSENSDFQNKFLKITKTINNYIDSGDINSANSILISKLRDLVNEELSQNYIPESIENVGLYEVQQGILYSHLSIANTYSNENSFFKIIQDTIEDVFYVSRKKGIENSNYWLIADLYLGNEFLTSVSEQESQKIIKPVGYQGQIKLLTYMIDKKIYNKFNLIKKEKLLNLDIYDKNFIMLRNSEYRKKIIDEIVQIDSIIEKNKIYLDKIIAIE